MDREETPAIVRAGWLGWAVIVVLLLSLELFLPGCAQPPRCAIQAEQVQHVGQNSAGDVVQIRQFVELCRAAI